MNACKVVGKILSIFLILKWYITIHRQTIGFIVLHNKTIQRYKSKSLKELPHQYINNNNLNYKM